MKTISLLAAVVACALPTARAQVAPGSADPIAASPPAAPPVTATAFAVTERGPHHRVWERIEYEQTRSGPMPRKHRFVELSTGMHYRDEQTGQWVESQELIEGYPGGATAQHGQHKVIFANNLATAGAIDLEAPDGKRFRSHVLGLSYYDSATDKSVLIAEVKDCQGGIAGSNQVLYTDAFTDLKADVRYTYRKSGLEQDVILREQPPAPEKYGLSSQSTRLQVLTEFLDPPQPTIQSRVLPAKAGPGLADVSLDFGAMKIGRGNAFLPDPEQQRSASRQVPVAKQWLKLEGRDFLMEEVPLEAVENQLQTLPKSEGASAGPGTNTLPRLASLRRQLPSPRHGKAMMSETIMARAKSSAAGGFILDYQQVLGANNFTFRGDTTYLVSGGVLLGGETTTIEGGAVIKFIAGEAWLAFGDTLPICLTTPIQPVVFTAIDDDTAGEILPGSTGNPSGYYSGGSSFNAASTLRNVRSCYLNCGVLPAADMELWNFQVVKCRVGFGPDDGVNIKVNNGLFSNLEHVMGSCSDVRLRANQVTVHNCGSLVDECEDGHLYLTNCLLVALTNWGNIPSTTNCTPWFTGDPGVFQTVGGGSHYLADNRPYRNAGTTNLDPALLADLRTKTTYPPIVYSNATISVPTTLGPQAQRDTDLPDLGYHYCLLDYAFGGVTADTNLTFSAGTAVGWFRTTSGYYHAGHGLHLSDRQTVTFDGTATAPCYWVRCNMVQEGGNGNWELRFGPGGITGSAWPNITDSPTVVARFTRFSMQTMDDQHYRDDWGWLIARTTGCEYYGAGVGGYNMQHFHTNCLWVRSGPGFWTDWPDSALVMRNCTMYGGILGFGRFNNGANVPLVIRDNAFDGTSIVETDDDPCANADKQHNAYLTGSDQLACSDNDVTVTTLNWQPGPLGNYYLPNNSSLTNAGSITADLIGLYHFTTQTNQVKETNSVVDIGYHYVALNANGQPVDTDGDGIQDYLEDANGNGQVDSGETDWQNAFDLGLKVLITQPRNNSTIP